MGLSLRSRFAWLLSCFFFFVIGVNDLRGKIVIQADEGKKLTPRCFDNGVACHKRTPQHLLDCSLEFRTPSLQ